MSTNRCVYYRKDIDTHGMVSITVPETGEYKVLRWNNKWVKLDLTEGDIVNDVQCLIRSTCPGYEDIKEESI